MAIHHEDVRPAIVVVVEKTYTPAQELRVLANAGLYCGFRRTSVVIVAVEVRQVVYEVRLRQIRPAVSVITPTAVPMPACSRPSSLNATPLSDRPLRKFRHAYCDKGGWLVNRRPRRCPANRLDHNPAWSRKVRSAAPGLQYLLSSIHLQTESCRALRRYAKADSVPPSNLADRTSRSHFSIWQGFGPSGLGVFFKSKST